MLPERRLSGSQCSTSSASCIPLTRRCFPRRANRQISISAAAASKALAEDWRQKSRPIREGRAYPAKEFCSKCGLCDSYFIHFVRDACAFLGGLLHGAALSALVFVAARKLVRCNTRCITLTRRSRHVTH